MVEMSAALMDERSVAWMAGLWAVALAVLSVARKAYMKVDWLVVQMAVGWVVELVVGMVERWVASLDISKVASSVAEWVVWLVDWSVALLVVPKAAGLVV